VSPDRPDDDPTMGNPPLGRARVRRGLWAIGAAMVISILVGGGMLVRASAGDGPNVEAGGPTSGQDTSTTVTGNTTLPQTTSVPVPATTTTVVAAGDVLSGTYLGTEHFAVQTGRCAMLDHHLDAIFHLGDATAWAYHADYCGTVDNAVWRGTGTFTFTTADGATLVGSFSDSARLPTGGVPYTLQITGGTGRYEGTTGSCSLTIQIRVIQFGVQEESGSFICHLAH